MRLLGVAAAAAVLGAVALAVLFPRVDPTAQFPTTLTRNEAVKRAAEWSAKLGVNPAGWPAAVTSLDDDELSRYRAAYPDDPAARLFTPLAWGVVFTAPARAGSVKVRLFADGRPAEWQSSQPGIAAPSAPPAELAGNFATLFAADPTVENPAWEWSAGSRFPLSARIETKAREGRLVSVGLQTRYAKGFGESTPRAIGHFLYGLFVIVGFVTALVVFTRAWRRGVLTWRLPAAMAVLFVAWWAISAAGGTVSSDYAYARGRVIPKLQNTAQQTNFAVGPVAAPVFSYLGAIGGPLVLLLFTGAGYGLARSRYRGKWRNAELAASGQVLRRQVCRPIAAGALCGIAIAAIPYAAAKLLHVPPAIVSAGALGAVAPDLSLVSFAGIVRAIAFLGFGLPLALRFRARWARFAGAGILLLAFAYSCGNRFDAPGPALVQGILSAAICVWLFAEFDLLAPAAALATAHAAVVPCILLAQPVASLRDAGVRALFWVAAVLAASVYFAVRGRDADEAEAIGGAFEDAADGPRSSRERLQAEFEVARKAQQDALPAVPPPAAGFTFDAVCEPALQVGGDLYDFFPLPDGRLGAAVADVSGKGVPAALYMMVTKGLIGAAAQDSADLRHILQSVNQHLHRACKRKVFVTMAAVALDPATGRVEYGRAGHNPIVWRRTRRGETLLVKPSGVGLGMCAAEAFGRSLRLQELELEPGDALVLYSDGVTEGVNPSMDQFGEDRLMRAVESADGGPAAEIRAAIIRDLAAFADGAPARDDVTVVAIRAPASLLPYSES
jgi:serine phosphatase RsbU (regulator of sigma subunit)